MISFLFDSFLYKILYFHGISRFVVICGLNGLYFILFTYPIKLIRDSSLFGQLRGLTYRISKLSYEIIERTGDVSVIYNTRNH